MSDGRRNLTPVDPPLFRPNSAADGTVKPNRREQIRLKSRLWRDSEEHDRPERERDVDGAIME